MITSLTQGPLLTDRQADLERLGFEPAGARCYRRDGFSLRAEEGWLTLQAERAPEPDAGLNASVGRPGFWRVVTGGAGGALVFELPGSVLGPNEEEELLSGPAPSSLEQSLHWALQTADPGTSLPSWEPPPRPVLEGWLPPGGLTVLVGPCVVQGELIAAPGRLALRFPLHALLPAELPPARQAWLLALLRDAQRLHRLVRLGLAEEAGQQVVIAEVDLSYAPSSVCERLFLVSLESLRWVTGRLAETVAYLVDPAAEAGALEAPPEPPMS